MLDSLSNLTAPTAPGFWASPPINSQDYLDRLGADIAKLSAQIRAATYQLLVLIREFDERGGWNTGFRSCAHWLNWRTGLDMGAAREKVRVARALEDLPRISESMEAGNLQLEHRYVRTFTDEDGMLVVRARLSPEVGALFLKALEAASEALFKRAQDDGEPDWTDTPAERRRADALELVAESALQSGLDPGTAGDRYQVVLHVRRDVSAETCADEDSLVWADEEQVCGCEEQSAAPSCAPSRVESHGELENGLRVSAETSRRLQCDSSQVFMTHGSDGRMLNVGRKTRSIHPSLRRALRTRDGGCRFPGCTVQHCDAHHVEHWAEGGPTDLDNLILLCRFHHRVLHEGGFQVELDAGGAATFYTPTRTLIPEVPPPPSLKDQVSSGPLDGLLDPDAPIDEWTGFPSWEGGPIDLGHAIESLRIGIADFSGQPAGDEGKASDPAADVSAETSVGGELLSFRSP